MLNRIRSVRKAKNMTLTDVAARCSPPTTAQTIGRLETGTRTLSIDWLNKIADALDVASAELVKLPDQKTIPLAAIYGINGCNAPAKEEGILITMNMNNGIGIRMSDSIGDYRKGDTLLCEQLRSHHFHMALNTDVLIPRPGGRFIFGRLIGREDKKLHILPLEAGSRQHIIKDPEWIHPRFSLNSAI